jgi:hypothetical protein
MGRRGICFRRGRCWNKAISNVQLGIQLGLDMAGNIVKEFCTGSALKNVREEARTLILWVVILEMIGNASASRRVGNGFGAAGNPRYDASGTRYRLLPRKLSGGPK